MESKRDGNGKKQGFFTRLSRWIAVARWAGSFIFAVAIIIIWAVTVRPGRLCCSAITSLIVLQVTIEGVKRNTPVR